MRRGRGRGRPISARKPNPWIMENYHIGSDGTVQPAANYGCTYPRKVTPETTYRIVTPYMGQTRYIFLDANQEPISNSFQLSPFIINTPENCHYIIFDLYESSTKTLFYQNKTATSWKKFTSYLSRKILVKQTGNNLRLISKYNSTQDIVIDFAPAAMNRLYTFANVALSPNNGSEPAEKDNDTGLITLFNAGSDSCPAPYSTKRVTTPAVYPEWVGGAHLTDTYYNLIAPSTPPENYPDVIPYQAITAVDSVAKTVTLNDATLFPTPNEGSFHLFAQGPTSGSPSKISEISRFSYTGKDGNNLTGVEPYVDTTPLSSINISTAKAAFVMKTAASASAPTYTLDGVTVTPDIWIGGNVLTVVTVNNLYDPTSLRHYPNTPASWDMFFEETITFKIAAGATIDILYDGLCKKANTCSVFYGMQTMLMSAFNASFDKMHYGHRANNEMRAISADSNSGTMDTYPNADKLIQYDTANKRIHCCRMDLSYGTPAAYSTMVTNLTTQKRFFGNATSKFYFTNIFAKGIALDEHIRWRGSYIETINLSASDKTLAYLSDENGHTYLTVDITASETFPYTEKISNALFNGLKLPVSAKDDTITITGQSGSDVEIGNDGIEFTATGYGSFKVRIK